MGFSAFAENKKLALVYKGPGACDGCPEDAARLLKRHGYVIKFVGPSEMTLQNLKKASLYLQPGGSDNVEDTMKYISHQTVQNLQKFVQEGGAYIGICAGAFLAGIESKDATKWVKGYALLDVSFDPEYETVEPKIVKVRWGQQLVRQVYYQAGPYLKKSNIYPYENVSIYTESGHSAAMIYRVGKGTVALMGPHFEAFADWYKEDHLEVPQKLNHDLFIDFLNRISH